MLSSILYAGFCRTSHSFLFSETLPIFFAHTLFCSLFFFTSVLSFSLFLFFSTRCFACLSLVISCLSAYCMLAQTSERLNSLSSGCELQVRIPSLASSSSSNCHSLVDQCSLPLRSPGKRCFRRSFCQGPQHYFCPRGCFARGFL